MRWLTHNLPGTGGLIKAEPEDFIVEEIPAYNPSGEGHHIFLTVEKRALTTSEMVKRLAAALGVAARDIGTAGQKDRQAIARQVVSVPSQNVDLRQAANLKLDGIEVLSAARHDNKLRTGHLRGNRFTIVVRGVVDDAEPRARAILERLSQTWLPNLFGPQRFGARGDNAVMGRRLVDGKLRVDDPFKRRLFVSAYQSLLFNRYLERRFDDGQLHFVIEGEVLQRTGSGGLFRCEPTEMTLSQARFEQRQIVPTGPMFGHEMFLPTPGSAASARENAILDEEGLTHASFKPLGRLAEGTRRALLARIDEPRVTRSGDALTVSFILPPGSYATVLLDEIVKPEAPLAHGTDA